MTVALSRKMMLAWLLALLGALVFCALAAALLVFAGRERARTESGYCANYECLANVLRCCRAPILEGALSQVPENAHNFRYYFFVHGGVFEVRFPFDADEFVEWAEGLGWTRDEILASHGGGSALLYDSDSSAGTETVYFKSGFQLTSRCGPDNREWREISYDELSRTVYLQFRTPLPKRKKTSSILPGERPPSGIERTFGQLLPALCIK